MCRAAGWMFIAGWLTLAPAVHAQALPARWSDLPKLAASWPPAWAALVSEDASKQAGFEKGVLDRVAALLSAETPSKESYRIAEIVLAATLRHHQSVNRSATLAEVSTDPIAVELEERLSGVRADWLAHLQKSGEEAEALRVAERWLPALASNNRLRSSVQSLWVEQAKAVFFGYGSMADSPCRDCCV